MIGSGITHGDGALWMASTFGLKTLKVDSRTGKKLASFDTPGVGPVKRENPKRRAGAHGLEWDDGKYLDCRASIDEDLPDRT